MTKGGAVYLMTNRVNTVIYTGVTSNLIKRVYEHKSHFYKGSFTDKYQLTKLVFYEAFQLIDEAICREKQIKAGSRKKKEALINSMNPEWNDLYDSLIE